MSNFLYYNNDANPVNGNPSTAQDYYNYMRNIWRNNTSVVYDGLTGTTSGPACKFMFPGTSDAVGWGVGGTLANPNPQAEWTEVTAGNTPADRRFLMSAGPFTYDIGEFEDVEIAVVWSRRNVPGAYGSFNKLLTDNDFIQEIITREAINLKGPVAPNVSFNNSNQTITINITPAVYFNEFNGAISQINTEAHQENFGSEIYSFQGYQIFQLKDSLGDITYLNYPDLAIQVAQCDIIDNISNVSNTGIYGSVNGANVGITHSFTITQDAFTNTSIRNNKKYFFIVVPYMISNNLSSPISYWKGCRNAKIISTISYTFANDPTSSSYKARGVELKKINGVGNSGMVLQYMNGVESDILINNYSSNTMFEKRQGDINIGISDINIASNKQFRLELFGRLVYDKIGASTINIGDTLFALNFPKIDSTNATNDPDKFRNMASGYEQIPGVAIVQRIVSDINNKITLEIKMLNDHIGGTFKMQYDSLFAITLNSTTTYNFYSHNFFLVNFTKKGSTVVNKTLDYSNADIWKLTDINANDIIYSEFPISEYEEQQVPSKGISILINKRNNPSFRNKGVYFDSDEDFNLAFLGSEIKYQNLSLAWQKPLDPNNWLDLNQSNIYDSYGQYINMCNGTWAPYFYTKNFTNNGPAYFNSHNLNAHLPNREGQLDRMKNVDIVYTSDQSKWTKVAVLQYDHQGSNSQSPYRLNKSILPSVDKNFNQTGEFSPRKHNGVDSISRGMSWFPGYAIDLDRGVRLNMMFSESRIKDPTLGNNLQWNPGESENLNSYIYVLNSIYDSCKVVQYVLDSIRFDNPSASNLQNRLNNAYSSFHIMYVGNVALKEGQTALQTEARSSIRVSRAYQSYNYQNSVGAHPEYMFTIPATMSLNNDVAPITDLTIYPNPNNDGLYHIITEQNKAIDFIQVYDVTGKLHFKKSQKGIKQIDLGHLASGFYIVKMLTTSGEEITKKVVLEK
jgi:hypothetical protein